MTLDDLGNLGELVGALAVIVSVGYLAIQIRQNTRSLRAAGFHNLSNNIANFLGTVAHDAELSRIFLRGLSRWRELTPEESQRFMLLMLNLFSLHANAYHEHAHGALESEEYVGIRNTLARIASSRGGASWWRHSKHIFSPGFVAFIEEDVARVERRAD
jgi:hypothetical protein